MFSISSSNCCCVRLFVPFTPLVSSYSEVRGRIASRYLEGKMLEEVCGAVGLLCLCSGAGIDPHADGRGLRIRGVLGSDLAVSIDISKLV